jgi:hypothetical protein
MERVSQACLISACVCVCVEIVLFILAAQMERNDDHSYYIGSNWRHVPTLVCILLPKQNAGGD